MGIRPGRRALLSARGQPGGRCPKPGLGTNEDAALTTMPKDRRLAYTGGCKSATAVGEPTLRLSVGHGLGYTICGNTWTSNRPTVGTVCMVRLRKHRFPVPARGRCRFRVPARTVSFPTPSHAPGGDRTAGALAGGFASSSGSRAKSPNGVQLPTRVWAATGRGRTSYGRPNLKLFTVSVDLGRAACRDSAEISVA